jgi:hypothetical protein
MLREPPPVRGGSQRRLGLQSQTDLPSAEYRPSVFTR